MRAALRFAGVVCIAACGPREPTRAPRVLRHLPSSVESSGLEPAKSSQYRLVTSAPGRRKVRIGERVPSKATLTFVDPSDERLMILAGRRIAERPGGYELADTVGTAPLSGGLRAPSFAGGGFVFWSREGLYRSDTFLGPLKPLTGTSFAPQRVAFGPGFLLASSSDGQRLVIDPQTGAAKPPFPIGLVDVAASSDGRVVAALELGRALVSLDRNATHREVQGDLGGAVTGLSSSPLGFQLEGGTLVTLTPSGQLLRTTTDPPPQPREPRWPLSETPLERAVSYGLQRGSDRALVAAAAAVAEVDLGSGELVRIGPQLLPGDPQCQLLRHADDLLMRCDTREALVIVSEIEGEKPVVERSFGGSPKVHYGFGQLVVEARCDGSGTGPALCARSSSGSWRALTLAAEPPSPDAPTPGVQPVPLPPPVGYALKADGGVVAFVNDSQRKGFVDFETGAFVAIATDLDRALDARSSCLVDLGGTLRCVTREGPLAFGPDGKLEPRAFRYSWLSQSGSNVLGFDDKQRLFQSNDFGRSWREVQPPPLLDRTPDSGSRCSEVGCRLGPWLRVGWEPQPPAALSASQPVGLPRPGELTSSVLACSASRAPHVSVSPLVGAESAAQLAGFGNEAVAARHSRLFIEATAPHQQSLGSSGLRGVASVRFEVSEDPLRQSQLLVGTPLSFRWVDPFDARGAKVGASLPLGELVRVPQSVGSVPPDLSFDDQSSFQALPVLSRDPGKAAGFVLAHETIHLWTYARKSSVLPLETSDSTWNVKSAIAEASGGLALLVDDGNGESQVLRVSGGASSRLFSMPGELPNASASSTPDALAVSLAGDLVVLRFTSGALPPSKDYPVLAYRPGHPVEQLAPWSTLRPSSDATCSDKAGYRAIVMPYASWLTLQRGSDATDQDWGMIALLRWSKERVCLEAVELADRSFNVAEQELFTRVTASFVSNPEAARLGFGEGLELRQPLTCQLR